MLVTPGYHELAAQWKSQLSRGMQEDGWEWDWTAIGTGAPSKKNIHAKIIAKEDGIWAAEGLGHSANELFGMPIVRKIARDGTRVKAGRIVSQWSGPARLVLALERPFLNLAGYVSGVATLTHRLVQSAQKAQKAVKSGNKEIRVTATRKTLPGYRDIAIHGVRSGGGYSHRVSLSGGVLIKENHIAAAGGISKAVQGARSVAPHGLKIEIEVRNLKELREALAAGAEVVMLDNFSPAQVTEAVTLIQKGAHGCIVECSGGIQESNIQEYVQPGVHVLSVGALTHSARALDLSLLVE